MLAEIEAKCQVVYGNRNHNMNRLPPQNKKFIRNDRGVNPPDMKHCSQIMIFNKEGKIMMVYEKGKYEFPGGKIKLRETPFEAVIRETKEEAGYDLKKEEIRYVSEYTSNIGSKVYTFVMVINGYESSKVYWKNINEIKEEGKNKFGLDGLRRMGIKLITNLKPEDKVNEMFKGRTFVKIENIYRELFDEFGIEEVIERMKSQLKIKEVYEGYYVKIYNF